MTLEKPTKILKFPKIKKEREKASVKKGRPNSKS